MDEHAIRLLELDRVIGELRDLCLSPQGAARMANEPFETEPARVTEALGLARAARAALESGTPLPGLDFPDITGLVPILGKEGLELEGEELSALGRAILSSLKLKRFIMRASEDPRLTGMAGSIPDLSAVSRAIFRVLDTEGNLKENRIPELAAIKARIRRLREEAARTARGFLDGEPSRSYFQTNLPTQRDGRLVLPLKAQFKGRVHGIVHEMSSSGSTVFIEPLEIVEKNNAIVSEESLYRMEVRRILRAVTAEASAHAGEIADAVAWVAAVDVLIARARYAIAHRCRAAETASAKIELREARHPLLGPGCIPITVAAGGEHRILIITGPNTGGKTVSLKTVGILALMNQMGIEIPAAEGSRLPVFDSVFADIGDEQSIEQSLSTFSAHVTNLAAILAKATSRSLVLLDELGAGTDPEEGVALAMALLDSLLEKGSTVLSTTHHGILKNYGYTRQGVQNASMGFDRETLDPTFRILLGVPGESHALEIARRRGIPQAVIENAQRYLADERTEVTELVKSLSERHLKLEEAEATAREKETDLREKWRRTDLKELTLRQKELELRRHGLREMREFLAAARKEWEALKAAMPAQTGHPGTSSAASEVLGRLQNKTEQEEEQIGREQEVLFSGGDIEIREGMDVTIRRTGRRARVLRKDRGKRWVVETETLRLSLLPGEMAPAAEAPPLDARASVSYSAAEAADPPVAELRLLGVRLEEALRLLEKQIDSALVHGLKQFAVIHGKGEGILQRGIHEYLKSSRLVEDYHFSAPEEGGFGRTWVVLKG